MSETDFLQRLREAFAVEAEEHLQAITAGLLELEKKPGPEQRGALVERIFREAHSLKGAASAVNRGDIETLCQCLESVFSRWKGSIQRGAPPESFDVLMKALDLLSQLRVRASESVTPAERRVIWEMARRVAAMGGGRAAAPPAGPPAPAPGPAVPALPAVGEPVEPVESAPGATERLRLSDTVRVRLPKMDALLLQAEEMVALKNLAARRVQELGEVAALLPRSGHGAGPGRMGEDCAEQVRGRLAHLVAEAHGDERRISKMVDELLADAKRLAMLPFAQLFGLFPKQVRDLASEQGKEVELVVRGSAVEIDKRILQEIKTPMIHLIRNALAHGIELPAVRTARGKASRGRLTIAVSPVEGGKVELVVADDGQGIDLEAVKAAAVEGGVLPAQEAAGLSREAALELIFHSGVSTSPSLNAVSGRGLGMAIVREKIAGLNGLLAIETQTNEGTCFRIQLPVSLATFRGILVRGAGQYWVIPTVGVERVARVGRGQVEEAKEGPGVAVCTRGERVRFQWMARLLGWEGVETGPGAAHVHLLILGTGEQRMALGVESIVGEEEFLLKKMAPPLERSRFVAGVTLLHGGQPALILCVADLLKAAPVAEEVPG